MNGDRRFKLMNCGKVVVPEIFSQDGITAVGLARRLFPILKNVSLVAVEIK